MARFCARVRKRPDLPSVSIKDIYQHPTIKSLATALTDSAPAPVELAQGSDLGRNAETGGNPPRRALRGAAAFGSSSDTLSRRAGHGPGLRVGFGGLGSARHLSAVGPCRECAVRIPVHGSDLGEVDPDHRWKPEPIRIWSLAYLRFWVVKTLVRRNPIVLFTGSPLFNLYLRRWARRSAAACRSCQHTCPSAPTCQHRGRSIVRKDVFINGYRAHAGFIYVGPISIGKNVAIMRRDGH